MKVTTFSFTCKINHLHNPHKIRKKCLKVRCHNLIIESEKRMVHREMVLQSHVLVHLPQNGNKAAVAI